MNCGCVASLLAILNCCHQEDDIGYSSGKNIKLFSYDELKATTKGFHFSNRIGRGGFGIVYKGTLKDGTQIAVKVLSAESKQGIQEFLNEIDMITNVKHPNLVELIGCCVQGGNRILVYEYVINSSLDRALLGSNVKNIKLDWRRRSEICIGTAKGLAYLHEELEAHIVHRDIKASNILLDENLLPKIGDFGLAKLFPDNVTHLSTRVAGTTGYLAPEYAIHGQLTKKADVYSYGVLVLEIVSGRSSSKSNWSGTQKFLLEWAWLLHQEGRLLDLVDPNLEHYPEDEVLRCMKIGLFCTQAAAGRRPSMSQVVTMLTKRSRLNENLLTPPGIMPDILGDSGGRKTPNSGNSGIPYVSSEEKSSTAALSNPLSTSSPIDLSHMNPR